jgi:naphthalene 1,2-dioxygenase system ferredoxin subunit
MNDVNTTVETERRWVSVANLDQVPAGSTLGVQAGDLDLVLCNVDGAIHCIDNVCTHAYALLSDGWLEGTEIECPLHGGRFDVKTGKALCAPVTVDLIVYPTRTVDGRIAIAIPAGTSKV